MHERQVLAAELIGTFVFMLAGPGVLVLGAPTLGAATQLTVALGVGAAVAAVIASVCRVSGGHLNPVVSLAMLLAGRIQARTLPSYLVGQLVGATLGGLTIWTIANNASDSSPLGRTWDGAGDTNFATNLWTNDFMGFWPMVIAEVLFTALLVSVYLTVTGKGSTTITSGGAVSVGSTLGVLYLLSIPIDNASLNPVRSASMALFAGSESLEQLWAFVVFPLLGALFGVIVHRMMLVTAPEAAAVGSPSAVPVSNSVRDATARATASVQDAVDD